MAIIETSEEAHFLVRVGTWSAADLEDWHYRRVSHWFDEEEDTSSDDEEEFLE